MGISFIVSTFNRPALLDCCLSSLYTQLGDTEIIVTDNSEEAKYNAFNQDSCARYKAIYTNPKSIECYWSAEEGAKIATQEWLCFPSDDSYYVPLFSEIMLEAAYKKGLDFVYCDCLYDPRRTGKYEVMNVAPRQCSIDKTCFIVKRLLFQGFPGKPDTCRVSWCDGLLAESLVARGLRHGKAPGVLVVHN